jgi:hypothetical protein
VPSLPCWRPGDSEDGRGGVENTDRDGDPGKSPHADGKLTDSRPARRTAGRLGKPEEVAGICAGDRRPRSGPPMLSLSVLPRSSAEVVRQAGTSAGTYLTCLSRYLETKGEESATLENSRRRVRTQPRRHVSLVCSLPAAYCPRLSVGTSSDR